ncbi:MULTISPECIES: NlpC/P60 family protein [unclassified Paenibacillus]|uniref:C40 family peptidase n=1 Tax=unclassified Paenibacillus TaxID=185978 RepID=UPI003D7D0BB4
MPTAPSAYAASSVQAVQTATVKYGVNFRTSASTSGKIIRMLKKGESVTIISKLNSSWYKVTDKNGKTGYVSTNSKYLSLTGQAGSGSGSSGSSNSGSGSTGSDQGSQTSNASVEKVISAGMKYWGTPYEFGSNRNSTKTFDCSAFVQRAFLDAVGVKLPGDSRKQGQYVKDKGNAKTSISSLKRGDLMFFMSYKGSKSSSYSGINKSSQRITHVGIYLGNNEILHTYSKESGGVRTSKISGTHWEYRFLYGGSAL